MFMRSCASLRVADASAASLVREVPRRAAKPMRARCSVIIGSIRYVPWPVAAGAGCSASGICVFRLLRGLKLAPPGPARPRSGLITPDMRIIALFPARGGDGRAVVVFGLEYGLTSQENLGRAMLIGL